VNIASGLLFVAIVAGVWLAIVAGRRPSVPNAEPGWKFVYSAPTTNSTAASTNLPTDRK
jgi:hypothetical protein